MAYLDREALMWWRAYLASLTGILTSEPEAKWDAHHMSVCASEHADAALTAYRKKWGETTYG